MSAYVGTVRSTRKSWVHRVDFPDHTVKVTVIQPVTLGYCFEAEITHSFAVTSKEEEYDILAAATSLVAQNPEGK